MILTSWHTLRADSLARIAHGQLEARVGVLKMALRLLGVPSPASGVVSLAFLESRAAPLPASWTVATTPPSALVPLRTSEGQQLGVWVPRANQPEGGDIHETARSSLVPSL